MNEISTSRPDLIRHFSVFLSFARYLALGDDGYLRYHESIPPIYQQDKHHGPPQNPQYNLLVKHTHRPKTILAILDGARVINPHSVVDQHVGLPSGVHGFVFRGRPVEILQSGVTRNQSSLKSETGGALILPSSNDPAGQKPTTKTKAVVNTLFPKGSQRRKTAQTLAKNAINPDVLGGFCSTANCDELSRNSSEEEYDQQADDDETWGKKSQESHGSTGSFQQIDRPGNSKAAMDESCSAHIQVKVSSVQSREYLCAVPTAVEAESWVVALRWAAEHRRRLRYHAPRERDPSAQDGGLQLHLETPIEGDENSPVQIDKPTEIAVADSTSDQANSATPTASEVDSSAKDSSSKESLSSLLIVEQDGWQPDDEKQPESSTNGSDDAVVITCGPNQSETAKSDNSPTIVMKVSRFRLPSNAVGGMTRFNKNHHNTVHWLPFQLPLPGDSLALEYEIKLLLINQYEPSNSTSSDTPLNSVEEKTVHKSVKSLIALIHRLMVSLDQDDGDSECSTPQRKGRDQRSFNEVDENLKLLEDCESILLECTDEQNKFIEPSIEAIRAIVDAIAGSVSCAMGSVDAVNDVVSKLATSPRICRSPVVKDFFRLDNSNGHRGRKLTTPDDVETIAKKWRLDKDTLSQSDRTRLYLAAILRHAVAGPVLSLAMVWTLAKILSSTCRLVSGRMVTVSLPVETYSFLLVLTFYVGHAYGMVSQRKRMVSLRKRRRTRRGKLANQMSSPSSFTDQRGESIMSDEADDESTVVNEEDFDDESSDGVVDNEIESLLSSPLPLYPDNGGVTCWSRPDHKIFHVRGKTYLRDRVKIPSGMYDNLSI